MNRRVISHMVAISKATGWKSTALWLFASVVLSGCAGIQSYPQIARSGDTVAVAIDRQADLSRQDIVIRVTDSRGPGFAQDIPGTDPAVRAWINVYPDPLSKLVVGRETGQTLGVGAKGWGLAAEYESNDSKDWFDSFLFLNLPTDLVTGAAAIDVLSSGLSILQQPIALEIIPGTGAPAPFETYEYGYLTANQFGIMERADHHKVSFSGAVVPSAVQVEITHDPDKDNGGVGQAYVVQSRADLNSINWTDDGTTLRVIVLPAWHKSAEDQSATADNVRQMNWFDFYVAGGLTGLQQPTITAYDDNGEAVTGVSAQIQ